MSSVLVIIVYIGVTSTLLVMFPFLTKIKRVAIRVTGLFKKCKSSVSHLQTTHLHTKKLFVYFLNHFTFWYEEIFLLTHENSKSETVCSTDDLE